MDGAARGRCGSSLGGGADAYCSGSTSSSTSQQKSPPILSALRCPKRNNAGLLMQQTLRKTVTQKGLKIGLRGPLDKDRARQDVQGRGNVTKLAIGLCKLS